MIRLGLKLTHDGGLAVLDGTELVFSHEAEKSDNQRRHAPLAAIDVVETMGRYGVGLDDVDRVVVDGWMKGQAEVETDGARAVVAVSHYHEHPDHPDGLRPTVHRGLRVGDRVLPYVSYPHSTGHVVGTYATSPWATRREPVLVLVWDGGMLPRLYHLDPTVPRLRLVRPLLGFIGNIYPVFGSYLGPFVPGGGPPMHQELPESALLDLSGRFMAWAGLGRPREELMRLFEEVYRERFALRWQFLFDFTRTVHERVPPDVPDEDVAASVQAWLGRRLIEGLTRTLERRPDLPRRLCFTGGCALNVGWNAALRAGGLLDDVWVPPFPNDAGSALGTAAADLLHEDGPAGAAIDWDVYRGPALRPSSPTTAFVRRPCAIPELAAFLHASQEPVVFLTGRAEIGPRALGHRSIFCSAQDDSAKTLLNAMKQREQYRPVAPICLESEAPRVFAPGTPDPYMLFVHEVRPAWRDRVPAIMHVDGTARLQTVTDAQNPLVARLLREYHARSRIPVLCNTSANLKGSGFFPDLRSAMAWPEATHIWSEGQLYSRVSRARPT